VVGNELQNAIQRINNLALVHSGLQLYGQVDAQILAQSHVDELGTRTIRR